MLSGGSDQAGWVIESYEDLWNEFSTQQLSHGNRNQQCKFCTQALQHDCQIQTLESWINPVFDPLANNETIRNKKCYVPFHFASSFKELEHHWHSKSSSFQLWVWEITLLFKRKMGYSLPYRSLFMFPFGLSISIFTFFIWFLSSNTYWLCFPWHPGSELHSCGENFS